MSRKVSFKKSIDRSLSFAHSKKRFTCNLGNTPKISKIRGKNIVFNPKNVKNNLIISEDDELSMISNGGSLISNISNICKSPDSIRSSENSKVLYVNMKKLNILKTSFRADSPLIASRRSSPVMIPPKKVHFKDQLENYKLNKREKVIKMTKKRIKIRSSKELKLELSRKLHKQRDKIRHDANYIMNKLFGSKELIRDELHGVRG